MHPIAFSPTRRSPPSPGEAPLLRRIALATLAAALFVTGLPSGLGAQVNIEKQRPGDDELGFSGSVALDLAHDSGNVDAEELTVDARADLIRPGWRSFVLVLIEQAWESDEQYLDEGLLHYRHVRRTGRRLQWEGFAQVDFNTIRRLDLRWLAGGGIRYSLTAEPGRQWYGSALMFEHEKLDLPAGAVHPRTTDVVRWSSYLTFGGTFEQLGWHWTTYLQPRVDELDDYRILSDATLEVELSERFGWTFSVESRYDSRPPDGVKTTDTSLASGLVIRWRQRDDEPPEAVAGDLQSGGDGRR